MIALSAVAMLAPATAGAATITPSITGVDDFDPVGSDLTCSLREAIQSANTNADFGGCTHTGTYGNDTIQLIGGVTYTRSIADTPAFTDEDANVAGDLDIASTIIFTVFDTGSETIVRGSGAFAAGRVMEVASGATASVSGVTIRDGASPESGGGILNAGTVNLSNSAVTSSTAFNGGGIASVSGSGATTNLINVTISGTDANQHGGGLRTAAGTTSTLENVTISGNGAEIDGDDIGDGGGISTEAGGTTNLRNTIVDGNSDESPPGPVAPDCDGTQTSFGHNLVGDTTGCAFAPTTGDMLNVSAVLGAFALSGDTRTRELLPASPAIDAGNPAAPGTGGNACAATDQRGVPRPQGPRCDIGAYEVGTLTPTTTDDQFGTGGACALRELIEAANTDGSFDACVFPADQGHDRILLASGATHARTINDASGGEDVNQTGDLDVRSEHLTIAGGAGGAAIEGNGTAAGDRVLAIRPTGTGPAVTAAISGVTIRNGRGNTGSIAGPVAGGILSLSTLHLTNSTVSGNVSTSSGGGIVAGGATTMTNVTISGNDANVSGGGFAFDSGTATLNNVTISDNTANADNTGPGDGGGIIRLSGTLNLRNSVVAGNTDPAPGTFAPDCAGAFTSLGHNLIGSTASCGFTATTGDATNVPAGLGPLADNGGPTQTHALLAGSAAIDTANPAVPGSGGNACAARDQRGTTRPQGAACDKGAFELVPTPATPVTPITTVPAQVQTGERAAALKKCKKKKTKKARKKCRRRAARLPL